MNSVGWFAFVLLFLWVTYLNFKIWKKQKLKREQSLLKLSGALKDGLSFNSKDYCITESSYKRSNRIERRFRRRYFFDLLEEFDHQCFNCKRTIKVECDHFFIPKSKGGNLMVKHREGYWVCNTILLCRACNSRKEDKAPELFFSPEQISESRIHINRMSELISKREC